MTSVAPPPPTSLIANLRRLALTHTADGLDDLIARATRARWSPTVLLDGQALLIDEPDPGHFRAKVLRELRYESRPSKSNTRSKSARLS